MVSVITTQDILDAPELHGRAEAFESSIDLWVAIEIDAVERYTGVEFSDIERDVDKMRFNEVVKKLVYWQWVWPDVGKRKEILSTLANLRAVREFVEG